MNYHTCGLYHTPLEHAAQLMPDLKEAWDTLPVRMGDGAHTVDVKIHMLMPGQWPCIPNWHRDFVPRDENLKLLEDQVDPTKKMYLWLSGPPITQFQDGREVKPRTWVEFTQNDWHRGVPASDHCWRTFIRVVPSVLCPAAPVDMWIRRHTQVYLNAENFVW